MNSRRQSMNSDASTTLSSFVKRRFNGNVPIFGGDIRTGIAEASRAVSNSVQTNLATALLSMSQALVKLDQGNVSTPSPTPMYDGEQVESFGDDTFLKCAQLDDDQLSLLLDASIVTTHQAKAYQTLIYAARDVIRKSRLSVDVSDVRKDVLLGIEYSLTDDELEQVAGDKLASIKQYAKTIGLIDDGHISLVVRAFINDSATKGKSTNRVLANVGNASLSVILRKTGYLSNLTVGRMSYLSQKMFSTAALHKVGVQARLHNMIVADKNVDCASRDIVAKTVEALFGVMEVVGGDEFVRKLNCDHLRVCDFENLI